MTRNETYRDMLVSASRQHRHTLLYTYLTSCLFQRVPNYFTDSLSSRLSSISVSPSACLEIGNYRQRCTFTTSTPSLQHLPTNMNSASSKIIFVTGANQGLGFAIIQVAALRDPKPTYVLASRNRLAGEEAVKKLRERGVTAKIEVVELDVTNDEQIAAAVDFIKTRFGKLDGECFLSNPAYTQLAS